MKKILLSHFYNEEYLLPFWLNHHKDMFDYGIMIDYNSTDNSCEIIKNICPNWKVYKSKNKYFSALEVDKEIIEYENNIDNGIYRICLNTTEFLIYNKKYAFEESKNRYLIPAFIMIDSYKEKYSDLNLKDSIINQRTNGIHYNKMFHFKKSRSFHNFKIETYPLGRHFDQYTTTDMVILWYGFSPFNKKLINRKLQIQNKIPFSDTQKGYGIHHVTNEKALEKQYEELVQNSCDLKNEINRIIGE